ncbi:MAG TPA: hypothetical protein ENI23_14345 [bacterium]|nr:hypothetical protein [bacterium]
MTPKGLSDHILYKLKIASTDFTEMLVVINLKLIWISGKINKVKTGALGTYSHEDLVEDQREYAFPDDVLNNLKAIFLKLDGTNFTRVTVIDLNDPVRFGNVSKRVVFQEDWITGNFSNSEPFVVLFRSSIFVFSGAVDDVTDGIQLWYANLLEDLPNLTEDTTDLAEATDKTSTPKQGLPKQFHELLARAVQVDYKETNSLSLTSKEKGLDKDLDEAIDQLTPQSSEGEVISAVPVETGEDN